MESSSKKEDVKHSLNMAAQQEKLLSFLTASQVRKLMIKPGHPS